MNMEYNQLKLDEFGMDDLYIESFESCQLDNPYFVRRLFMAMK